MESLHERLKTRKPSFLNVARLVGETLNKRFGVRSLDDLDEETLPAAWAALLCLVYHEPCDDQRAYFLTQ